MRTSFLRGFLFSDTPESLFALRASGSLGTCAAFEVSDDLHQ